MQATLSWTANTESDLFSYKVYVGTSPGVYDTTFLFDGMQLGYFPVLAPLSSVLLSSLSDGIQYYFAVSAVDTSGNESALSSEVSKINRFIVIR